jgi:competence protein ComEA
MQMNEKQTLLAGAAALALIVFGALFWIAPVWQFGYAPAAYQPPVLPAQAEPAPEPTREEQGPVNINTASAEELTGIGQAKAEAILADRAANGPYAAPEDLTRVKGISQRMVQQWESDITVGG